jgi:hypothetical protein
MPWADGTRRDIVVRTLEDEHSVSALARNYPMSSAAVQQRVAVPAAAGLVTKRRKGRATRPAATSAPSDGHRICRTRWKRSGAAASTG